MLYARLEEGVVVQESLHIVTGGRSSMETPGYVPCVAVRADAVDQVRSELIGPRPSDYPELRSAALDNSAWDAGVKAGIGWTLRVLGLPVEGGR